MNEITLKTETVAGRKLAWREAGAGMPVVFLHGIGSGSGAWTDQMAAMASGHRVIAWDAPGYGGSDDLPIESPSAVDYADAFNQLLAHLNVSKAHLVGISLGALMAAAFAARWPGMVTSLVLSNVATGHAHRDPAERKVLLDARIDDMATLGPEGVAKKRSPKLMGPNASDEACERVRRLMSELRPGGYAQAARMLSREDIFAHLKKWTGPTLVIAATDDAVTPLASVRTVADACQGSRLEVIDGAGHQPQIEMPHRFNSIVGSFLQSVQELAA